MAKKISTYAIYLALALIASYIERLIPFNFGIPGIKLGLANIVIVVILYCDTPKEAFCVNILRIVLANTLFGNFLSLSYALFGGVLSFLAMLLAKRSKAFSIVGVSIAGGIFHNVGQILAAMLIVSNFKLIFYLPVLLISGVVTGALIGIGGTIIIARLKKARDNINI